MVVFSDVEKASLWDDNFIVTVKAMAFCSQETWSPIPLLEECDTVP
jgi:hypothetical protein